MSGGSNGVTVMGPAARRAKWCDWYICLVAGRTFVGRLFEKRDSVDGWERYLQPFFDFNSGFVPTPQGLAEMHRVFPPLALSLKRLDLPKDGFVLFAFGDLDDAELEGLEHQVDQAEEMWKAMRAARSGLTIVPPGAGPLPPMPKKPG